MPTFPVLPPQHSYAAIVERGVLQRISEFIPKTLNKVFIVTTQDVWRLHGDSVRNALPDSHVLFYPGGESNKRLAVLETLADQMLALGADRKSIVIGFGGGIVTDVGGFLAAVFMRGLPVIQIPTTLLAQVDAAVGGKTGVNLAGGKNIIGSFHQPESVLIDPEILATLPEREYRAGLFEVVKTGIIRDPALFEVLEKQSARVLAMEPALVEDIIAASVKVKAEVVSLDEKEGDLRRILNFGHTIGHAIEAETGYVEFLHGEAVAWGMLAATRLAVLAGMLAQEEARRIAATICRYGPLPPARALHPGHLIERLASDKKTLQGKVHFVLPTKIGEVKIVSGIDPSLVRQAIVDSLR